MADRLTKLFRDLVVTFAGVLIALIVLMALSTLYRDHLKTTAMWTAMNKPAPGPMILPHR